MKDEFGDRMKSYEICETSRKLDPELPVYARIDGRGFSKFTKGMARPYDNVMANCMIRTTEKLIENSNALVGYTQSDEISLVWENAHFFDGKIQKLCSVLSSLAAAKFMREMSLFPDYEEYLDRLPHFDCRIFSLPSKMEAANMILWREQDASKNAVSMAARHYFSHKALQGKSTVEKLVMLADEGVDFKNYFSHFKHGSLIRKETHMVELTSAQLKKIPEEFRPESGTKVPRTVFNTLGYKFGELTNRVEYIFDDESPILKEFVNGN